MIIGLDVWIGGGLVWKPLLRYFNWEFRLDDIILRTVYDLFDFGEPVRRAPSNAQGLLHFLIRMF